MNNKKYTGINKLFKSNTIEIIHNKVSDGTFLEFIDDWKWIFSFSKRYTKIIVVYTILGITSSSLTLGSAYLSKILINIITGKQTEKLVFIFIAMLSMIAISLAFNSLMSRMSLKISLDVNNDIQSEIFDNIMDSKWLEINKYENGDILNRFSNDVSTISTNAISWIPNLIINIYTFVITFIVLYRLDHIMAYIAILSAPFLLLMSHYILRNMKDYRKKITKMKSKMMSFEAETFYNFDTIKSFGINKSYSRILKSWQSKYKNENLEYNKFEIKTNVLMTIVSTIVTMTSFGYSLFRLWTGKILYGDMTFFLTQRSLISNKFTNLVSTIPSMLNSAVSAHRIRELVDLPKEEHDEATLEQLCKIADKGIVIELDDITFSYKDDTNVIESSSFIAKPNEIIAVLGESGSGKTTMFRLILAMINPNKGSVNLIGEDGNKVKMNCELRKLISYVPQGNTMILGTIAENMRMVKEDATDEEIIDCLKAACAWQFVEDIGIDAKLGEKGKGISEGQAQRLSIARALLKNAPILMLDEATSALDKDTEEKVLNNIIKRSPNKTIIVSTHRPSVLSKCQRIYKIEDKKINVKNN